MLLKLAVGAVALVLGIVSQFELDEEVLITSKSVALTQSRAKVFQFLSDMRNVKKWYPKVTRCEPIDMAPMSTGKHFMMTYSYMLYGEVTYNVMISGYESPKHIAFFTDDWLNSRTEIEIEKRVDRHYPTYVTWKMYSRNRSYITKYVMGPLLSMWSTGEARSSLLNLRYQLQV